MRSIKEIFVVGNGPSSSHTMGPSFAVDYILKKYPDIVSCDVTLFGSLALTGKGHLTDYIIDLKLKEIKHSISFDTTTRTKHPNTMSFEVLLSNGKKEKETIVSIGGGTIKTIDDKKTVLKDTYSLSHLTDIIAYCKERKLSLVDYIKKNEESDIIDYLSNIYDVMEESKRRGIESEGELPGTLHVKRKAHAMNERRKELNIVNPELETAIASFAVSEENAAGGVISIAPTCGSAGVIPGDIAYLQSLGYKKEEIVDGLLVAGLIGIIAKTNASISGAECGCQAEIGVACAMGAAMVATVLGFANEGIAQSAEIAMEHSLGLTCDPIEGYVQIPCIERCAVFALKAIDAVELAALIPSSDSKISFDRSLKTMYETGRDLKPGYRETSKKGLAQCWDISD